MSQMDAMDIEYHDALGDALLFLNVESVPPGFEFIREEYVCYVSTIALNIESRE